MDVLEGFPKLNAWLAKYRCVHAPPSAPLGAFERPRARFHQGYSAWLDVRCS